MAEVRFSGQSQYGLNLAVWGNTADWAGNYTNVRVQCYVHKYSGTGYAGTDGWYVRGDTPNGGLYDIFNSSGTSWSFQNGASTGDWWIFDGSYNVTHDANGYGSSWVNVEGKYGTSVGTASIGTGTFNLGRIPKRPSVPGTPQFTNALPTSVTVSWAGSSDNAGSAIDAYLLRYWPNAEGTGSYIDHSQANNTSRTVTGLTPGSYYRFRVYAHNGAADNNGYSNPSGDAVIRMLSGGRIRVAGVYKTAIPYQRVAGAYKIVLPFVRSGGVYKNTQ
jgi:Fibronectin type III domain.